MSQPSPAPNTIITHVARSQPSTATSFNHPSPTIVSSLRTCTEWPVALEHQPVFCPLSQVDTNNLLASRTPDFECVANPRVQLQASGLAQRRPSKDLSQAILAFQIDAEAYAQAARQPVELLDHEIA